MSAREACTPSCDAPDGSFSSAGRLPVKVFTFTGIIQLIGWNAVLTACSFLDHDVFPTRDWAFKSSIVYATGVTIGQGSMIRGPLPRVSFGVRWTLSVLAMVISIVGLFVMVALTVNGALHADVSFPVCLICVVILSLGCAVFQASTFGLAGAADASLNGALMMGQGVSGLITGVASFLKPSLVTFGIIVWTTAAMIAAAQGVYLFQLRSHPIIKQLLANMAEDRLRVSSDTLVLGSPLSAMASPRRRSRRIMLDVLVQAGAVFFVFAVTFTLFPGVVDTWSGSFGLPQTQFCTVLIGVFQIMDVVGRTIASWVPTPNGKVVVVASIARVVFVPLFIGVEKWSTPFFQNGAWKVIIMALFASSNGLVSTFGMMLGPQGIVVKEEKETAGHFMSFFLVFGILVGTLMGLVTQI